MQAAGFKYTKPYHAYVPSFGDWGFMLASNNPIKEQEINVSVPTKFLDDNSIKSLFHIEKDVKRDGIKSSTLNHPEILNYYLNGWRYWN